jgi:hypothetical protein
MAEAELAKAGPKADAEAAPEEERHDRTGWIDRAAWFGVRRHTVAGAVTLLDGRKHTFTRAEIEAAIADYQGREA